MEEQDANRKEVGRDRNRKEIQRQRDIETHLELGPERPGEEKEADTRTHL